MARYQYLPLNDNVEEMFIGPFGSSLKNDAFVDESDAFCMVYEQKHAIKKTMNVETRYVNCDKYEELKRFNIKGGDIIVSCRGTIGETYIVPDDAPLGIMHPSIMKIRLKSGVYNKQYFNLLLRNYLKRHEDEANGSGIKMAISAKELGATLFPVPNMAEQDQIASAFEQLEELIVLRKEQLAALDQLVKSRFIELFGDCDKEECLGNIATFIKTGKLDANAEDKDGSYPFFTCDSVPKRINQYAFDMEAILISGNGSQVGHIHYYNGKFNAYQRTYVVSQFASDFDIRFLQTYLRMELKPYIMKNKKGSAIPYITLPMLQNFAVLKPPIELQEQFSTFVEQTDKSKLAIQRSLDELETLKKALMQKYFG